VLEPDRVTLKGVDPAGDMLFLHDSYENSETTPVGITTWIEHLND